MRRPALLPYAVFAALYAASFQRWVLPFQDSGREVMTADRLAQGEVLYRDVAHWYGPMPAYLDAAALHVLGRHLNSLFAIRTVFALLALEAIRRLCRRLVEDELVAASLASFVVAACFFLPFGAYPFPFSVAALEGTAGAWLALELALGSQGWGRSLAAGAVAGLAAGTKLECVPAALLAVALPLSWRRPRGEALVSTSVALLCGAAAWGLPVTLLGARLMKRQGFLLAGSVPAAWTHFYRTVFWGGGTAADFASWHTLLGYLPSALLIGGAVFLWSRVDASRASVLGLFATGLLAGAIPDNGGIQVLVPLALVLCVRELWAAVRERAWSDPISRRVATLCIGVVMVAALIRQPFSLPADVPYSAFAGPLALMLAVALLIRGAGSPRLPAALLLGLCLALGIDRVRRFHEAVRQTVTFARGRLVLLEPEAKLLVELHERIQRDTPPGSYVAAFPDAALAVFLSERRSPFAYDQFYPGTQDREAERRMIAALDERPVAAGIIVNRVLKEFGFGLFGEGYDEGFRRAFEERFVRVAVVGAHAEPQPRGLRADQALYYLRRPRR